MTPNFPRNAIGVAVLSLASFASLAQAQSQPADAASLREVTVTGNPLGASELIAPTTTLSGDKLLLRSESTLGETLNNVPGVSSSYFGPNASRPIIRGQDGDRIRILQNGGGAPDASALSYDHAVPVDALVTDRIEVLRGPSALQYGGS
ncbi:TonB-dependent receptor plug domain-containing protein, partial [Variovorax sp. RHLX14]